MMLIIIIVNKKKTHVRHNGLMLPKNREGHKRKTLEKWSAKLFCYFIVIII